MLFDQLCKFVERHRSKDEFAMLQKARLFRIQRVESRTSPRKPTTEKWHPDERVVENFRIPFPVIAIEESASRNSRGEHCFVMSEISREERRFSVIGIHYDTFISADLTAFPDVTILDDDDWSEKVLHLHRLGSYSLDDGSEIASAKDIADLRIEIGGSTTFSDGGTEGCPKIRVTDWSGVPDEIREHYESKETLDVQDLRDINAVREGEMAVAERVRYRQKHFEDAQIAMSGLGCSCAIMDTLLICDPSTFIVEESTPDCGKQMKRSDMVRRSRYREHFITLTPREIKRRLLGIPDDESVEKGQRRPHERRGHYKRLQSDRYVNKKGQTIWVKACWIGPQEGVVGKNKYKVRIDL